MARAFSFGNRIFHSQAKKSFETFLTMKRNGNFSRILVYISAFRIIILFVFFNENSFLKICDLKELHIDSKKIIHLTNVSPPAKYQCLLDVLLSTNTMPYENLLKRDPIIHVRTRVINYEYER